MTGTPELWARFTHDPRDAGHASLRAADVDRDVVHQVLAEAYADGRLDREELDARTTEVTGAKTLGDLVPPLEGLVSVTTARSLVGSTDLTAQAVVRWERTRREALLRFVTVSLICWAIWLVGSLGPDGFDPYFAWPVFVSIGTGIPLLRIQASRSDMVQENLRRLEKKQRKELEAPKPEPRDPEEDDA